MTLDPNKFKAALQHTENQKGHIMTQKDCEACQLPFYTVRTWERRCELCRELGLPRTKRVFNPNIEPF